MAIQWADSFSRYGLGTASRTAMQDGLVYSNLRSSSVKNGGVVADPDPNLPEGARCYALGSGSGNSDYQSDNRISLPTPVTNVVGVAARFWFASTPSTDNIRPLFIQLRTVGGSLLAALRMEQNGSITSVGGTSAGDSVVPVLTTNAWNHVEFKYDCATGAGEVRINGVQRMTFSNGATGTCALVNHAVRSGTGGSGVTTLIKDYVIWDDTGTENVDFLGSVRVGRLKPNADVTLGGWVPSEGSTGFNLLAKDEVDDDTYLSADDAPPAAMQFEFEDLSEDVTSVRAVLSFVRMRKTDGGDATVQTSLSPNGTDWDNGADRPITSTFAYWFDVSEISPDTTDPWTPSEVNDIIGEIDRTL